jgi:hypothetical protein
MSWLRDAVRRLSQGYPRVSFTTPRRGEVDLRSKSGEGTFVKRGALTPHPALRADLSQRER